MIDQSLAKVEQNPPKMVPRSFQISPRWPKVAPRCSKISQDAPKIHQDLPKMSQDLQKIGQDGPRSPQDGPRPHQKNAEDLPKDQISANANISNSLARWVLYKKGSKSEIHFSPKMTQNHPKLVPGSFRIPQHGSRSCPDAPTWPQELPKGV